MVLKAQSLNFLRPAKGFLTQTNLAGIPPLGKSRKPLFVKGRGSGEFFPITLLIQVEALQRRRSRIDDRDAPFPKKQFYPIWKSGLGPRMTTALFLGWRLQQVLVMSESQLIATRTFSLPRPGMYSLTMGMIVGNLKNGGKLLPLL